jgi:HD domain
MLTDRFNRALLYATHIHGGQVRKGTSTPYVAHLLAVAATVLEYGGDEDLAIAALLHDSVEDQGGKARLTDVRNRFGERVARIVEACSDSLRRYGEGRTKGALAGSEGRLPRTSAASRRRHPARLTGRQSSQCASDPARPSQKRDRRKNLGPIQPAQRADALVLPQPRR